MMLKTLQPCFVRSVVVQWQVVSTSANITSSTCSFSTKPDNQDQGGRSSESRLQHATNFSIEQPALKNPYVRDPILKSYLERILPKDVFTEVEKDLRKFGGRIVGEIDDLGRQCEIHPPTLDQFNAWGKRIDSINTCHEWKTMKHIAAEEGLIASGYTDTYGQHGRLYQMVKLFLFSPSSGLFSCPLAMTDGAAKILSNHLHENEEYIGNAYKNLTSTTPSEFWTSGQWMTEKQGGSDVGNATDTYAYLQEDGTYKLYGYKWFTSATDADMAFTLARVVDDENQYDAGTKGLSLFYLETKHPKNDDFPSGFNCLRVQRLKNKLGTKQLPTAELILDGTVAHMVGKRSEGIKQISDMLTITRIHNSITSAAAMRRIMLLSKDYAKKREAFGSTISDHPLHMQTLARMDVESRAATFLTLEVARLLGVTEHNNNDVTNERNLLRILTPVCKLYTAKQAVAMISEGLESFGGAGYLEDTGLPTYLRDAQVLTIWEGTTNILSLDLLRSVAKSRGETLNAFFEAVNYRLGNVSDAGVKDLRSPTAKVHIAVADLRAFISQVGSMGADAMFLAARDFAYSVARIFQAVLLLEHAAGTGKPVDKHAVTIWLSQDLCPASSQLRNGAYSDKSKQLDTDLVYDEFT